MNLDAFDESGQAVLTQAWRVARSARHSRIGSGHLLRACLDSPVPSRLLTEHGLDVDSIRGALPGPAPDRDLLAAIGIDLAPAEIRDRIRRSLGIEPTPPILHRRRSRPLQLVIAGDGGPLPLTSGARKVLEVATWRARGSHQPDWTLRQRRPAASIDLLAGLLADRRNPMRDLLVEHGLHIRPPFLTDLHRP